MGQLGIDVIVNGNTKPLENSIKNVTDSFQSFASNATFSPVANPSTQPPLLSQDNQNFLSSFNELKTTQSNAAGIIKDSSKDLSNAISLLTNTLVDTQRLLNENNNQQRKGNEQNKENEEKGEGGKAFSQGLKILGGLVSAGIGIWRGNTAYQTGQMRADIMDMQANPFGAMSARADASNARVHGYTSSFAAAGTALGALGGPLGMAIGAGIGSVLANVVNGVSDTKTEKQKAEYDALEAKSQMYEQQLPYLDKALAAFGGSQISKNDRFENRTLSFSLQNSLLQNSRGTGMDLNEFENLAFGLGKYGVTNVNTAGQLANRAAMYARYTNGDASEYANFAGLSYRLGNNGIRDLDYAYGASRASGLTSNQYNEFLSGLQNVIETGISKGYVKSTKEVSDTMVMFNKLSNNDPTWQGKYGFQKLQTMNSGLESATSLSNSSQVLAYQALYSLDKTPGKSNNYLKGQNELNTLILMEQGFTPSSFSAIGKNIGNAYAGDVFSQIAAWKDISGLNWTGASKLFKMYENSLKPGGEPITQSGIDSLKENINYISDSEVYKNLLNGIKANTARIGSSSFDHKLDYLERIYDELAGRPENFDEARALFAGEAVSDEQMYVVQRKLNKIKDSGGGRIIGELQDLDDYRRSTDKFKVIDAILTYYTNPTAFNATYIDYQNSGKTQYSGALNILRKLNRIKLDSDNTETEPFKFKYKKEDKPIASLTQKEFIDAFETALNKAHINVNVG